MAVRVSLHNQLELSLRHANGLGFCACVRVLHGSVCMVGGSVSGRVAHLLSREVVVRLLFQAVSQECVGKSFAALVVRRCLRARRVLGSAEMAR